VVKYGCVYRYDPMRTRYPSQINKVCRLYFRSYRKERKKT